MTLMNVSNSLALLECVCTGLVVAPLQICGCRTLTLQVRLGRVQALLQLRTTLALAVECIGVRFDSVVPFALCLLQSVDGVVVQALHLLKLFHKLLLLCGQGANVLVQLLKRLISLV